MLNKLLVIGIVFGVVAADSVEKRTFTSDSDVIYADPGYQVVHVTQPDLPYLWNAICSLIGYKASALTVAENAIEWFISNIFVIFIGAASAFGFCKITGKCNFNYEEYIPITQLQGLVTPENIETAEKIFVTAVEKYAEKKKRSL